MKMNENNCELVPEERLMEIRDYFLADKENKPFFVFSDNKHQATCELAAAEGMRDALVYQLEAKLSVASDMSAGLSSLLSIVKVRAVSLCLIEIKSEIDNAIKAVDRRYDELLTEYEKGPQTVILH